MQLCRAGGCVAATQGTQSSSAVRVTFLDAAFAGAAFLAALGGAAFFFAGAAFFAGAFLAGAFLATVFLAGATAFLAGAFLAAGFLAAAVLGIVEVFVSWIRRRSTANSSRGGPPPGREIGRGACLRGLFCEL